MIIYTYIIDSSRVFCYPRDFFRLIHREGVSASKHSVNAPRYLDEGYAVKNALNYVRENKGCL